MVSQGWGHSSQTTQVIFWMLEALPRHRVDQVKDPGYELDEMEMNASCFLRHTACSEVGERGTHQRSLPFPPPSNPPLKTSAFLDGIHLRGLQEG